MFVKLCNSSRLNVDKEIESGHMKMLECLCFSQYCLSVYYHYPSYKKVASQRRVCKISQLPSLCLIYYLLKNKKK